MKMLNNLINRFAAKQHKLDIKHRKLITKRNQKYWLVSCEKCGMLIRTSINQDLIKLSNEMTSKCCKKKEEE